MTKKTSIIKGLELSPDRYKFLVENSGDLISTHRPGDWAYTAVNPALTILTGYSPEEVMGKPAYDFFYPEDAEAMKEKLIPAIYHHGVRSFRYRHRHKNGSYLWLESTHRSVRDPNTNTLSEIIAVTRDISPQIEAEMTSKRLADVLEVSSDLLVFCDQDFNVTYMNKSALAGFNLKKTESIQKISDLINPESFQKIKTLACLVANKKGRWQGNIQLIHESFADKVMTLQEVLVHPQRSNTITNDYYALIIRDISDQILAEQEAQRHQLEIAHASRLMTMGEMASGLAHEINQPLATTLNYTRGAIRQIESNKIQHATQLLSILVKISRQTDRAAAIVKRLRTLVKKTPYQRQVFFINPVCEEVAEFLKHEFSPLGISLVFELTSDNPKIEADRVQIEQVLINLLRNAVDAYAHSENENKTIVIKTQIDKPWLIVRVTDFGVGIDEDFVSQLFEPYISTKKEGLGMGLSISRTIIEAHGGTIDVSSDGKTYSQFQISLPLQ